MSLNAMTYSLLMLGFAAMASVAHADPAAVKVELNDGPNGMVMTLDKNKVETGPVEFEVSNKSMHMQHEVLIIPWQDDVNGLPYDEKTQKVDEDKLVGMVGVEDLDPNQSVTARFMLAKGRYLIFCNEPGHYKANMKQTLEVN
ncbi:hypothetical protein [Vogesella sp. LIG4]|uniref:hypothetical protein n=1 Tax=Vogesella sp. LIG4 TaxID=1192162 RepID=UPI00081FA382|nr:hypothetical protein [Vogesella sp. LIG4]SCK24643.1 Uncharacterized copper-binding protein, cupredoxin-like subfamily [Vogesella sp. LIG4]